MILFLLLTLTLLILTVIVIGATSLVGAFGIVLFSDVIVLIIIIGWLIHKLYLRKKN